MRGSWILALFVLAARPVGAAQVETFVLGVGGDSSGPFPACYTYAAPAPVLDFFGPFGLSEPQGSYAGCSIQGGYVDQTAPLGPLADSYSGSFAWPSASVSGSTNAVAQHGELSAAMDVAYAGQPNSVQIAGFEGFGRADDTLTITSPSVAAGSSGSVRFFLTLTGGLSLTAAGTSDVELHYYMGPAGP